MSREPLSAKARAHVTGAATAAGSAHAPELALAKGPAPVNGPEPARAPAPVKGRAPARVRVLARGLVRELVKDRALAWARRRVGALEPPPGNARAAAPAKALQLGDAKDSVNASGIPTAIALAVLPVSVQQQDRVWVS